MGLILAPPYARYQYSLQIAPMGQPGQIQTLFLTVLEVLNMNPAPISDLYNKIISQSTASSEDYIKQLKKSVIQTPFMTWLPSTAHLARYQYGTSIMLDDLDNPNSIIEPVSKHATLEDMMMAYVRNMTHIIYYATKGAPNSANEVFQYKKDLAENLSAMYNHTGELSQLMYTTLQEHEDGQNIIEPEV
jgi:hypothetical protein